jgi:hypothetical protein
MKKTFCPTCGQSTDRHKHTIARQLANVLLSVQHFTVPFHLQKDTNLTKNQYTNFHKLKYWGLVSNRDVDNGCWYITNTGRYFLQGKIKVPKWVMTYNNHVVERSDELIDVEYCRNFSDKTYKKREEYAQERKPHFNEGGQACMF